MTGEADTLAIEADGLVRSFGEVDAVRGITLAVEQGELYGLIGPDGAGKTTAIRCLTGLLRPDDGEARVVGLPVAKGALAVREAVGYMPQQYSLYGDLSVDENLKFFGRLFGLPRAEYEARRKRLLGLTRLLRFSHRRADALSGGMYKKLALACALLHRPRVLVLDEPTNGVDPVSRRELWDLLYEFVHEGMAVLLATPYMDEAARCHRVGLISQGELLAEGIPRDLAEALPQRAFLVHADRSLEVEASLDDHPDVIALSPQGSALRVVVRADGEARFRAWMAASQPALPFEPIAPDFEDVFLVRVFEQEAARATAGEAQSD